MVSFPEVQLNLALEDHLLAPTLSTCSSQAAKGASGFAFITSRTAEQCEG